MIRTRHGGANGDGHMRARKIAINGSALRDHKPLRARSERAGLSCGRGSLPINESWRMLRGSVAAAERQIRKHLRGGERGRKKEGRKKDATPFFGTTQGEISTVRGAWRASSTLRFHFLLNVLGFRLLPALFGPLSFSNKTLWGAEKARK